MVAFCLDAMICDYINIFCSKPSRCRTHSTDLYSHTWSFRDMEQAFETKSLLFKAFGGSNCIDLVRPWKATSPRRRPHGSSDSSVSSANKSYSSYQPSVRILHARSADLFASVLASLFPCDFCFSHFLLFHLFVWLFVSFLSLIH